MPRDNSRPRSLSYSPSFSFLPGSSLRFDFESEREHPTRSPQLAEALFDMFEFCPEAGRAIEIYVSYALGSSGGDELGFVLEWEKGQKLKSVAAARILDRVASLFDWLQLCWRLLAWGDAFASLVVEGNRLERLLLLPTWQLFRFEDPYGSLLSFEQRQPGLLVSSSGGSSGVIRLDPASVVHWRYFHRFLYGRSLFYECVHEWTQLRFMSFSGLPEASRSVAIQPNLHIMPQGADSRYKGAYRADHEAQKRQGIVPDIYLDFGGEVRKPTGPPSVQGLDGLLNYVGLLRRRIIMRSGIPPYLLGADDVQGAREISMQPAAAFVVSVGLVRQFLAAGIRQVINVGLALEGFSPPYKYQIKFPRITANPFQVGVGDFDLPGDSDVGDA